MGGKVFRATVSLGAVCAAVVGVDGASSAATSETGSVRIVKSGDGLRVDSQGSKFREVTPNGSKPLIAAGGGVLRTSRQADPAGSMRRFAIVDSRGTTQDAVIDRTVAAGSGPKSRVGWIRTGRSIGIEWPSVEGISSWSVRTPSGRTVSITGNEFIDNSQAQSGTYLVTGANSVGSGNDVSYVLTVPKVSGASLGGGIATSKVESGTAEVSDGQWRGLAWSAFIEEEFVDGTAFGVEACQEKDEYVYYGGDGRSYVDNVEATYSGDEPRFRIGSLVASMWKGSSWVNPAIYDNYVGKEVGLTRAFNADHELVATKRADAGGIDLVRGSSEILPVQLGSLGLATREVKMSLADPLCTPRVVGGEAPAIDIEFTYRHTSNGWVTVDATHDKAPMHEVFWVASSDEGDPSKPNGCLYRYRNRGLSYLTGFSRADVLLDFNPSQEPPSCVTDE